MVVCVCVCVCVCVWTRYLRMCMYTNKFIHTYTNTSINIHMNIHTHIYKPVKEHVHASCSAVTEAARTTTWLFSTIRSHTHAQILKSHDRIPHNRGDDCSNMVVSGSLDCSMCIWNTTEGSGRSPHFWGALESEGVDGADPSKERLGLGVSS